MSVLAVKYKWKSEDSLKIFIYLNLTNKMQHRIFFFHDGREIKKMIASTGKKEIKEKNIKK
jgi:hypothetical protein